MPQARSPSTPKRMKKILKKLSKSKFIQEAVAFIAYLYMRFVHMTTRWTVRNRAFVEHHWGEEKPMIVCFWHNRLLMMTQCWRKGVKAAMLISEHRDGKMISKSIEYFGVETIVGSTSRGGHGAFRDMVRAIKQGYNIGITPDGPRGPRYRAAAGAVQLAKLTGCPIVPVTVATSRVKILGSWDSFILNYPFGRGIYLWGQPVIVPQDADANMLEQKRKELENNLISISQEADIFCGYKPIEAAEGAP